jgi:hypothetical protein
MARQYWVVGGEYQTLEFDRLVDGTSRVLGPFQDIDRARQVWREWSEATRAQASTRYTIVTNAGVTNAGVTNAGAGTHNLG